MGWEGIKVDKKERENNGIVRWGTCGAEGSSVSLVDIRVEVCVCEINTQIKNIIGVAKQTLDKKGFCHDLDLFWIDQSFDSVE
jgi:hypothetical protein